MIKTIQQYAIEKGTSPQNVRNKKKLPIIDLEIFALHKGQYIPVGKQKFIEVEK